MRNANTIVFAPETFVSCVVDILGIEHVLIANTLRVYLRTRVLVCVCVCLCELARSNAEICAIFFLSAGFSFSLHYLQTCRRRRRCRHDFVSHIVQSLTGTFPMKVCGQQHPQYSGLIYFDNNI